LPLDSKSIGKAVGEAKKNAEKRKFRQSVELVVSLRDLDMKKPESRISEFVELPNPISKPVKVCVFASGDLALRAQRAGADRVMGREDLEKMAGDKKAARKLVRGYDFFIAEAPLMSLVGKVLGAMLGPRGKMPTPVPPTAPIDSVIERHRRSVRVRVRDQLNSQCRVGTEDMPDERIAENIQAVIARLEAKLPKGLRNIRAARVKTTMGSGAKIEISR